MLRDSENPCLPLVRQLLWLEISPGLDESQDIIHRLLKCRQAMDDFLNGKIRYSYYLEILESNQVNLEDYQETLEDNLFLFK